MKTYTYGLLILLLALNWSCKSTKSLTSTGTVDSGMSAKQVIRETQKQEPHFKTLQARVRFDYTEGDKSSGSTVTLRMEKDKAIWLSATLGLARIYITPDRVQFYYQLSGEYFDGDFSLLTDVLGAELNFENLQNIFLGEPIFNLKDDQYVLETNKDNYILQPKTQRALFELFYLINPGYFKTDSQQLYQPAEKRMLQVDYKRYQSVGKQIFPENIRIIAVQEDSEITIEMEMKNIQLDEPIRFPFKMPSGYKEIVIN